MTVSHAERRARLALARVAEPGSLAIHDGLQRQSPEELWQGIRDGQRLRDTSDDVGAAIRAKALAGDYGKAIQRRAERRDIRHDLLVSLLPENLQQDLQALRLAPADQRPQLRAAIIDKALAGEYGADVQKAAERLKALHQG